MDIGLVAGTTFVVSFFWLYFGFRHGEKQGQKRREAEARKELNNLTIKGELQKCAIFLGRHQALGYIPWISNLLEDIKLGFEVTPDEAIEAINKTIGELQGYYDTSVLLKARQRLIDLDSKA